MASRSFPRILLAKLRCPRVCLRLHLAPPPDLPILACRWENGALGSWGRFGLELAGGAFGQLRLEGWVCRVWGGRERWGLGLGDELRMELRVLVAGVGLASCCWVSGLGLSLLAGGGPPCSPWVLCWAPCPAWLQLWFWWSGWFSALVLLSSVETKMVEYESKTIDNNFDYYYANSLKDEFSPNKKITYWHLEIASNGDQFQTAHWDVCG